MPKVKEVTGGVDETEGKTPYLEEQNFVFCLGCPHTNVILKDCIVVT